MRHNFSSAQTLSAGLAVKLKCPSLNVRKYGHPWLSNFALLITESASALLLEHTYAELFFPQVLHFLLQIIELHNIIPGSRLLVSNYGTSYDTTFVSEAHPLVLLQPTLLTHSRPVYFYAAMEGRMCWGTLFSLSLWETVTGAS